MSDEYGPHSIICRLIGCWWSDWVGPRDSNRGKKCRVCGRWKYEDGKTLPGVRNQ